MEAILISGGLDALKMIGEGLGVGRALGFDVVDGLGEL
jgi:hypothetical protein